MVYDVASVRRTLVATATGAVEILENEDALPRAYLVERARLATQMQAFEHLKQASVDFERTVLLERDPGAEHSALFEGEGPGRPLQAAAIVHYAPERAVISARSRRPAVLVLTDTYYPGWRAYVDGEETEILRANGLFRAVRFPSGKHEVVFEFRPQSFRWGVVISLVSLGLLLAAVAANRWRT